MQQEPSGISSGPQPATDTTTGPCCLLLQSCWLVVHGKVYDVTDFLEVSFEQGVSKHPVGFVGCPGAALDSLGVRGLVRGRSVSRHITDMENRHHNLNGVVHDRRSIQEGMISSSLVQVSFQAVQVCRVGVGKAAGPMGTGQGHAASGCMHTPSGCVQSGRQAPSGRSARVMCSSNAVMPE